MPWMTAPAQDPTVSQNWIDKSFANLPSALHLRAQRSELLASNLANADTPHYKARDLDFARALSASMGEGEGLGLRRTQSGHLAGEGAGAGAATADIGYRQPHQPSVDGNTVETDLEQAAFAENAVRYQATITFLNSRISGLISALKGE